MKNPIYAVYGASGCGRGIMPLAQEQLIRQGVDTDRLVFVDDNPSSAYINGYKVINYREFINISASVRFVVLAIADGKIREKLAQQCDDDGIQQWSVSAENVIQMDEVTIGIGSVLSPFVTITSNVCIGKHFHANIYSYVEHDCVIGDFVTFAPRVSCNGNVVIEDHAYIGTGAVIKQGKPRQPLTISKGAVVGMGAVVTKSVPAGATVVGNPARVIKQ